MGEKLEPKWATKLRRWAWENLQGSAEEAIVRALCLIFGHKVLDDQCEDPAHRFCGYCDKSTPFARVSRG